MKQRSYKAEISIQADSHEDLLAAADLLTKNLRRYLDSMLESLERSAHAPPKLIRERLTPLGTRSADVIVGLAEQVPGIQEYSTGHLIAVP